MRALPMAMLAVAAPLSADAQPRPVWRFELGAVIGVPRGDLDEETRSTGIGVVVGRSVAHNVSVFGAVRSIAVETDRMFANYEYELHHTDVLAGARYALTLASRFDVFGEAHLDYARLSLDHSEFGGAVTNSGVGFGARAGVIVRLVEALGIGGAVGYSRVVVDFGGENVGTFGDARVSPRPVADAWVTFDVFVNIAL